MGARVWNYLTGYVMIEVKGRGLERFVNRATHAGVPLWRIRRTAADAITACVGIAGFYELRHLVRGTELHVRIIGKRGLPIGLSRARGREVLFFGWVLLLALVVAASRFIWHISLDGCDVVSEAQIIETLAELGVETGSPRSAASTFDLGGKLMASDSRIAWAGVRLEGVILRVSIVEARPYAPGDASREPGSLYAAKDGVVTRIELEDGRALIVTGKAVRRGQALISGILRNDELGRIVTRARGKVMAQVVYTAAASAGPMLMLPQRTGEAQNALRVSLFSFSLGGPEEGREAVALETWRLTNCFLPVTFELFESYALENRLAEAPLELIEAHARARAERAAFAQIPKDAVILSKVSDAKQREDGSVTVTITVVTEENIAELRGLDGN